MDKYEKIMFDNINSNNGDMEFLEDMGYATPDNLKQHINAHKLAKVVTLQAQRQKDTEEGFSGHDC